jgi:protein TonB
VKPRTFLFLSWEPWSVSFGIHLFFILFFIFLGRTRTVDLTEIDLDMAPPSPNLSTNAPAQSPEEEWRKPETIPKFLPPPPQKLEIKTPPAPVAPVVPATAPSAEGGAGSSAFRSIAQVSQMPRFKVKVKAVYPEAANHANIEGVVILKVDIDATGAVKKVDLIQGLGYGCDESAIAAVEQSSFIPAYAGGEPVPVRITIPYRFTLDDNE